MSPWATVRWMPSSACVRPNALPGDLATPNPVYFQRVDTIVELAAARNMFVLLNPIETIGWLSVLRSNGMAKARDYGMFLGNRYRRFSNTRDWARSAAAV